ncbi:MAG: flagellar motor protein MotB [Pseudomonadota bacterium]
MSEEPVLRPAATIPHEPPWLITFADLVSLLLTFFVMLFAMGSVDVAKWRATAGLFKVGAMTPAGGDEATVSGAWRGPLSQPAQHAADLDYLAAVLAQQMAQAPQLARATLHRLEDRLVISLPGSIEGRPRGLDRWVADALFVLGGMLGNLGNQVEIHGHVDPLAAGAAAADGPPASTWGLSLARAAAAAAALRAAGYRRTPAVIGFGDGRYAELSPTLSAGERRVLANRVDIVIRPIRAHPPRNA